LAGGPNWIDEYPIEEMPNKSGKGSADYVLLGDNGLPLAVIEAKRTSLNVKKAASRRCSMPTFWKRSMDNGPSLYDKRLRDPIWSDKYYPERPFRYLFQRIWKKVNKMKDRAHSSRYGQ
jgi:type I restriction enzyme R subunit